MIKYTENQLEKLKNWIVTLIKMARQYDGRVITKAENGAIKISTYDRELAKGIQDAVEKLTQAMYLMNERERPYLLFEKDLISIFKKAVDNSLGKDNTAENIKLLTVHSQMIIKCAENSNPIAFKKSIEVNALFNKINSQISKDFINKAKAALFAYGETEQGYKKLISIVQDSFGSLFKYMIIAIQLKDFNKI